VVAVQNAIFFLAKNVLVRTKQKQFSAGDDHYHQWIKNHAIAVPTIVVPSKVYH